MADLTTFTLQIGSANAAMTGDDGYDPPAWAVADQLAQVADLLRDGHTSGRLRDVNDNRIGSWSFDLE